MSNPRLVACAVVGLIAACKGGGSPSAGTPSPATALERACDRGDLRACGQAASLYLDGKGVAKDLARGLQLYQRACTGKDAPACATLATLYKEAAACEALAGL